MACFSSQDSTQISSKRALHSARSQSRLSLDFPLLSPLVAASLVKRLQPSPGQGGSRSPARQPGPDRAGHSLHSLCRLDKPPGLVVKVIFFAETLLEPRGAGEDPIYWNFSQGAFCKQLEGMNC